MTAALFGLSCSDEDLHSFEDLVRSPHVSVHEVFVMDLQKPMIFFVLFRRPMTAINVFQLINVPLAFFPTLLSCLFSLGLILTAFSSLLRLK